MTSPDLNNLYNSDLTGHNRAFKPGRRRVRTAVKALSVAGGGATALVTTISAVVGYKAVRPRRRVMGDIPPGLLLPPENVRFKSTDGLALNGYFYPGGGKGESVIICHGFHGAAADVHEAALHVQSAGYNILTFDFRGCGASEGRTTSVGYYEVRDVLGAIEYLKTRPDVNPRAIGAYGFSMGGATAILAAGVSPDIKALVTDSAFASLNTVLDVNFRHFFRLPSFPFKHPALLASKVFSRTVKKKVYPLQALQQLQADGRQVPLLIIHGEQDGAVPVTEAYLLHENHAGPKELWISPGARHVVAKYEERSGYSQRVTGFFDQHLKVRDPNLA